MINVFIADDHTLVRHGLRVILEDTGECRVTGEAATGTELVNRIKTADCDVLIMDLQMPGASGLDLLKQVRAVRPDVPILVFSMHPEDNLALRLLRAGAAGYIGKHRGPGELVEALRRVAGGRRYLTTQLADKLVTDLEVEQKEGLPHEHLSDREYEVACLLASAWTVTAVAEQLQLSVKTVSTYRTRVMDKLGLHTNAELIHYMLEHAALDPSLAPPAALPPECMLDSGPPAQ